MTMIFDSVRPHLRGLKLNRENKRETLRLPAAALAKSKLIGYSLSDQGLAIGGGFLANIALARTQTKDVYGIFALNYSVFSFLLGLYYAAILEPFTVYGAGRYKDRIANYIRLMLRFNAIFCCALGGLMLTACLVLSWAAPRWASGSAWGLAIASGMLLSGYLLRRLFYVLRQPLLAAKSSLVFFIFLVAELWFLLQIHRVNGFSTFLAMAVAWIAAWAVYGSKLPASKSTETFIETEPQYWKIHWTYSRWAFATAFVFQFTQQGYYWLIGAFLSPADVANLRAMYLLVGPVEQVFIALSYLIVPALAAHYAAGQMAKFLSLWKIYVVAVLTGSAIYALGTRLIGKTVVHILYAGKYDGVGTYLFVLTFVPMILWLGATMSQALNAVERPEFQFWAYVCGGATTLIIGIPLVVHFGLWGAVYGMLVSGAAFTLALAASFVVSVRRISLRLKLAVTPSSAIHSVATPSTLLS